jgi:HK97 family phage prohead protease
VIEPGAFTRSLAENPDVRALYNHSTSDVLGRTKNGTLVVAEDSVGLRFELELPDTSAGRDVRELVRLGTIDGCSFGFFALEDRLEPRAGLPTIRHLVECHVYEITPATAFPAYDATEVRLRSTRHAAPPGPAPTPRLALARARLRLAGL